MNLREFLKTLSVTTFCFITESKDLIAKGTPNYINDCYQTMYYNITDYTYHSCTNSLYINVYFKGEN